MPRGFGFGEGDGEVIVRVVAGGVFWGVWDSAGGEDAGGAGGGAVRDVGGGADVRGAGGEVGFG